MCSTSIKYTINCVLCCFVWDNIAVRSIYIYMCVSQNDNISTFKCMSENFTTSSTYIDLPTPTYLPTYLGPFSLSIYISYKWLSTFLNTLHGHVQIIQIIVQSHSYPSCQNTSNRQYLKQSCKQHNLMYWIRKTQIAGFHVFSNMTELTNRRNFQIC